MPKTPHDAPADLAPDAAQTKALAETLKASLHLQEMSAAELARRSGVSIASLSRILNGSVHPSFQNMMKISRALGIGLDTLAGSGGLGVTALDSSPAPKVHESLAAFDVLVTFVLTDTDKTTREAAQLLENAANGTWVTTWTEDFVDPHQPRPRAVASRQVGTRRVEVDMAFPHCMVEEGSMTGLLSVIAAGATSTGARMLDIRVPEVLLRTYQGPALGARGIRDYFGKYGRPLLSATMRPMLGLSPRMYGRAVFEALKGGVDMTCDPTLMHGIPGNSWRERFRYVAEAVHDAGVDAGELKAHAVNITAGTVEHMQERARWAKELELGVVMVDSAAIGWTALQSMSNWCRANEQIFCAMGGRTLGGAMMSEQLEAKLLRLTGCDVTSIGSPLRGSVAQRRLTIGTISALKDSTVERAPEGGLFFNQPFAALEASLPAVGGGHNPWHFPRLLDALGDDVMIQCGGSVMGHPWGSAAGATANRVAIEALVQARNEGHSLHVDGRTTLQRAMRYSPELKTALEFWQEGSFLFGVVAGSRTDDGAGPLQARVDNNSPTGAKIMSLNPATLHTIKGDNNKDDDHDPE
ncbi:MAG: RuBisCO large subunit C-terminal-like domain-containing protein [Alphaproteobacteria bacterium]